jgi:ABC-type cobalt transport system substrate-binding protein
LSGPHKQPPARVPTLTEVVALDAAVVQAQAAPAIDPGGAEHLAERVAKELHPWVDPMFEQRLREALAPGVEALLQALVKQFRGEFDALLREAVGRALAQGPSNPSEPP